MTERELEWYDVLKAMRLERRDLRRIRNERALDEATDVRLVHRFSEDHCRIEVGGVTFDYWPSTGRWQRHPLAGALAQTGGLGAIRRAVKSSGVANGK